MNYSEIVGLDVQIRAGSEFEHDLNPGYEHALLVLSDDCSFEKTELEERVLYYLGISRSSISIASRAGSRVILIGGPPFPEIILMWWNFVARTPEEIAQARADWEAYRRFGQVPGEHGPRLAAPDLLRFARPNPASSYLYWSATLSGFYLRNRQSISVSTSEESWFLLTYPSSSA